MFVLTLSDCKAHLNFSVAEDAKSITAYFVFMKHLNFPLRYSKRERTPLQQCTFFSGLLPKYFGMGQNYFKWYCWPRLGRLHMWWWRRNGCRLFMAWYMSSWEASMSCTIGMPSSFGLNSSPPSSSYPNWPRWPLLYSLAWREQSTASQRDGYRLAKCGQSV